MTLQGRCAVSCLVIDSRARKRRVAAAVTRHTTRSGVTMKRRAIAALVLGATTLALSSAVWVGGAARRRPRKRGSTSSCTSRAHSCRRRARPSRRPAVPWSVRTLRSVWRRSSRRTPTSSGSRPRTKALRSAGRNRPVGQARRTPAQEARPGGARSWLGLATVARGRRRCRGRPPSQAPRRGAVRERSSGTCR